MSTNEVHPPSPIYGNCTKCGRYTTLCDGFCSSCKKRPKTKPVLEMTDDGGHFWLDGKLYKIKRCFYPTKEDRLKGTHKAEYVEVDPLEYDARVNALAQRIANFPQVNTLDIIKDALYDMALVHLTRLEDKLNKEEQRAKVERRKPQVETKHGERGTCVELRIANRFAIVLRD
jgi:hypothetical protein